MAKDKKSGGPSPAYLKMKVDFAELKKKSSAKLSKLRKDKPTDALINTTGTMVGAVPVGIFCGAVPETWEFGAKKTQVPSGLIAEGLGIFGGVVLVGIGYLMKSPYTIHVGGGASSTASALLAKRGTVLLVAKGKEMWSENRERYAA